MNKTQEKKEHDKQSILKIILITTLIITGSMVYFSTRHNDANEPADIKISKMERHMLCPRCSSPTKAGFIMENYLPGTKWYDGYPVVRLGWDWEKHSHPIVSYRCSRCGYLESYAPVTANDH